MHRTAYTLTLGVFVGAVASFIETIRTSGLEVRGDILLVTALATWTLAYFLMFIFFVQLYQEKPNTIFVSIVFFVGFFHVFNGVLKLHQGLDDHAFNLLVLMWDLGYNLMGIVVFTYGAFVHYDIYKKTSEKTALLISGSILLIAIGFVIALLGDTSAYLTSENIIEHGFFNFGFPVGDVLKFLGLIVFVIFYLVNFQYIFRLPVNISTIMIFNNLGLLIYAAKYSHETNQREKEALPIELVTASLSAFETFMKQTTHSETPLRKIETQDKRVVIESGKLASVAIIADKATYFLINSMKELIKELENNFEEHLKKDFTDSSYYAKVPEYIKRIFPYLPEPSSQTF